MPIKVDSPNHPLTSMFKTEGFDFKDEIYQFGPRNNAKKVDMQPYSRGKLRVLLSIDNSKFTGTARPDNDYAISGSAITARAGCSTVRWATAMAPTGTRTCSSIIWRGCRYVLGDLPADVTPRRHAREEAVIRG